MQRKPEELIVAGDRALIALEAGEERSKIGRYLPSTAVESPFEKETYLVVSPSAILALVRGGSPGEE